MEVSFSPHENYNAQIPYVGDIDSNKPGASRPRRAWEEGAFLHSQDYRQVPLYKTDTILERIPKFGWLYLTHPWASRKRTTMTERFHFIFYFRVF